jgi:hypothetical protein
MVQLTAIFAGESAALSLQLAVLVFLYFARIWQQRRNCLPWRWRKLELEDRRVLAFLLGLSPFLVHALWQRSRAAFAYFYDQWRIGPFDVPTVAGLPFVIAGLGLCLFVTLERTWGPERGIRAWRGVMVAVGLLGVFVYLGVQPRL